MQEVAIKILNTGIEELSKIISLFEQAINLQSKSGYKVWNKIDKTVLEKDIENKLQYKIMNGNNILCIFSVQQNDPLIWREKDQNDAIYLHRIVVNQNFKGQKQFEKVLNWGMEYAKQKELKYIRMDTWAENEKLITYYKSFGFRFVENFVTSCSSELPVQNRNLSLALLEMKLEQTI
ncbi:MAG: GNAT family N-acetyltransferase [Pelobium sp.]